MSRIGKQTIEIPQGTDVTIDGVTVTVKGPKGTLSRQLRSEIGVSISDGVVSVTREKNTKLAQALWGTYASHIKNMIHGVNEGYEKKLIINGVGFRAAVQGTKMEMHLGFSHPVELSIPEDVTVTVEKELVTVSGIDKETVGHFAAVIRAQKKPEPYKGKGIQYEGEVIRRKAGKKAVASA